MSVLLVESPSNPDSLTPLEILILDIIRGADGESVTIPRICQELLLRHSIANAGITGGFAGAAGSQQIVGVPMSLEYLSALGLVCCQDGGKPNYSLTPEGQDLLNRLAAATGAPELVRQP